MAADIECHSLGDYINVSHTNIEEGVEAVNTSDVNLPIHNALEHSSFINVGLAAEQTLDMRELGYVDVNITTTAESVQGLLEASFINVNLMTEETVGAMDTSRAVALLVTRRETHVLLRGRSESCPAGDWRSSSTPGDTKAIEAHSLFLRVCGAIQEEWLCRDDQPITKLKLTDYKYNEFTAFFFLRVSFIATCTTAMHIML